MPLGQKPLPSRKHLRKRYLSGEKGKERSRCRERMKRFLSSKRIGWSANTLYIILIFVVVFVIMASFMPAMRDMIGEGVSQVSGGEGGALLSLLFYSVPILLILMALYAILVLVANR